VIRSTKFIPPVSNVRSNMSLTNQEWAERRMAAIPRGVSQTSQIYTARAQNAELWTWKAVAISISRRASPWSIPATTTRG